MSDKKKVNLVITDLDDTIWDWLVMWHSSFKPYFDDIREKYGINESTLKEDFKKLHQKYKTSEASYIYNELESLTQDQKYEMDQEHENEKSILHKYYSNKKHSLQLYPGVLETLNSIKAQGTKIIGFTESNDFFTKYRIKHLNLDGVFDSIYSPTGYELPDTVKRVYEESFWDPEITKIEHLPSNFKKPNPEVLEGIIKETKGKKDSTIYIGDKPEKDIYMAHLANVTSVHAKYGHLIDSSNYNLLKEVTHWSEEEVKNEQNFTLTKGDGIADFVIQNSFTELMSYFSFIPFE